MALFPVIMCGGAGTRLWPSSRPSLPKQFMRLAGDRSLFQETVERVAGLSAEGGQLIVVGGERHQSLILDQLAEIGVTAQLILEPEGRDSAAAMAAAAIWTRGRDADGINVFVASDHYIPDADSFREAVLAAAVAAGTGRLITLGVVPTEPSSAYGYIEPAGEGLASVRAFVEKPSQAIASTYMAAGYLWNSGNFITAAETLIQELRLHAPAVYSAVSGAFPTGTAEGSIVLTHAFIQAPRISIDYAVMERTDRASVLPVSFDWSDLGAWDAVSATGEGSVGSHIFEDAEGCLVRAADGVMVVALGVRNLAIVVEDDAVLVCDLARSQEVKKVVERLKTVSPQHLDFKRMAPEALGAGGLRFRDWLRLHALPVWSSLGQDSTGAFAEALTAQGRAMPSARRARVQMRQIQVFAEAGRLGWQGPWHEAVKRGLARVHEVYRRPDGLVMTLLGDDGSVIDDTAMLYDQAFYLFALASAVQSDRDGELAKDAARVRDQILASGPAAGGFVEGGAHPYQSNAHMHLLEAGLAWEAHAPKQWAAFNDRIVALASRAFIDGEGGFLREFFQADWSPADGDDGRLVEPGHQFEWAWLLARYGRMREDPAPLQLARRLYDFGMRGFDQRRGVVFDALNADGSIRSARARLWPQTEWLKASLILAEAAVDGQRAQFLENAALALRSMWKYVTPHGVWRDKMLADGSFIDEPAPASSFYHIMAAYAQLAATHSALDLGLEEKLTLD